jgi:hypothetical protein
VSDNSTEKVSFDTVLDAELKEIDERRRQRNLADPANGEKAPDNDGSLAPLERAHQRQLLGLAFSGGGIRSATFNLGFLQGLAGLGLLKIFDYLSTVSGGGYIGAWLAAWMRRHPGGANAVEQELNPEQIRQTAASDGNRPDPIRHLRRHSNYLAPRQGFLSTDRWVLGAIYLRNFLLNQLVLLSAALIVVLLSRLVMFCYYPTVNEDYGSMLEPASSERLTLHPIWIVLLVLLVTGFGVVALKNSLAAVQNVRGRAQTAEGQAGEPKKPQWLLLWVVAPLGLGAVAFCFLAPYPSPLSTFLRWQYPPAEGGAVSPSREQWTQCAELVLCMAVVGSVVGLSYGFTTRGRSSYSRTVQCWCIVIGLVLALLLFGAYRLIYSFYDWDLTEPAISVQIAATARLTTFGPPLVLLCLVVAISLGVGLLRNEMGEQLREWFASVCAWLLVASAAWLAVNLIALYGTAFVLWASPWVQTALASGWLLTLVGGVVAGSSERTGAVQTQNVYRELFARLAVPVFAVGIFVLVSLLVHFAIDNPPKCDLTYEGIWPYRYQPEPTPSRISITRTGAEGNVTVQRNKEYLRNPDEAAVVRQQYWLGMLNTNNKANISHYTIWVDDADIDFLEKADIPRKRDLRDRLKPLKFVFRHWERTEFESELMNLMPEGSEQQTRERILNVAREQGRVDQNHFNFKKAFLEGIKLRQELLSQLERLQYWYRSWTPEEFRAELGKLMPQDAEQREMILALAKRTGTSEGDKDHFVFMVTALEASGLPGDLLAKLEPLQWYRDWDVEALQDEIDRAFPEAVHLQTKRLILQRLKGLGSLIEIGKPKFFAKIGLWLVGCVAILWLGARRVDVNAFSLHGLYGNRLVRAYLGASRVPAGRVADPVTGFDPDDDLSLANLDSVGPKPYDGPFLILNTAMNLVHTRELAWQDRKAESFALTALYCGSETTGYRGTNRYAGGMQLGTAVTISGAAASPNMGYHSSPAVTFLLTVFNARLGAWLGNPKNDQCWTAPVPRYGFLYLFRELFGWTDESSPYVYLSDGGHFENLGVYELVKRRCKYVVVCDAGQDVNHAFEDLGNLIRKVRIDLGIRIQIAPDFLGLQKDPRHTRWHCAIGKIRYDDVDTEAVPGMLIYIKPSLTGDEPADVLHYAAGHPSFPHETTANQFYTESQFESYRALGQHIAEAVFEQSVGDMTDPEGIARSNQLFASLQRRWFAMPPEYEAKFVASTQGYIDVQEAFRNDPRLWRLTLDLYPELDPAGVALQRRRETTTEQWAARRAAELHVLAQMLQVMENAYLSLDLEVNYAHPMNRGWMDIFHRWTSAETFRSHWPHLRAEFAREFVRFCERQMRLGEVIGTPVPLQPDELPGRLNRLLLEFEDQWPEYRAELEHRLDAAMSAGSPSVWVIYAGHPELLTPSVPAGIILVSRAGVYLPPAESLPPAETDLLRWENEGGRMALMAVYDLFVWLRGAYRNTGLGRPAVREILKQLPVRLRRPFRLRTRLPLMHLTGPGGKLQRAMWLTFFYQLEFIRAPTPTETAEESEELELRRDFP